MYRCLNGQMADPGNFFGFEILTYGAGNHPQHQQASSGSPLSRPKGQGSWIHALPIEIVA
jgi:hypothetical protein